jgi:hypothetical protein
VTLDFTLIGTTGLAADSSIKAGNIFRACLHTIVGSLLPLLIFYSSAFARRS